MPHPRHAPMRHGPHHHHLPNHTTTSSPISSSVGPHRSLSLSHRGRGLSTTMSVYRGPMQEMVEESIAAALEPTYMEVCAAPRRAVMWRDVGVPCCVAMSHHDYTG